MPASVHNHHGVQLSGRDELFGAGDGLQFVPQIFRWSRNKFFFCYERLTRYKFFHERRVDLFKTCISAPGAAREALFRHSRSTRFLSIGKGDEDPTEKIKFNLVSGNSLIMNHFHSKGEIFIRDNLEKPFRTVQVWDAANLYGKALSDELSVGVMHRWLPIDDSCDHFKARTRDTFLRAYDWLDCLEVRCHIFIKQELNSGKEYQIGPYPIDGYHAAMGTVYQFFGCYYHAHSCQTKMPQKERERERDSV